ncbi:MAG TPA: 50S ribosomal protein L18 [Alphaproteobacteria bacterium]|nr:50S ribosomal protein L18 [Alphaproteobacteria bacterium]
MAVTTEKRRLARNRFKIKKAADGKPRLSVFRSNKNLHVQVIDDVAGVTVVSASTVEKDFGAANKNKSNQDSAKKLGALIAQRAKEKNVTEVVFDRGGYLYHGRVKALADAAREAGLKF